MLLSAGHKPLLTVVCQQDILHLHKRAISTVRHPHNILLLNEADNKKKIALFFVILIKSDQLNSAKVT